MSGQSGRFTDSGEPTGSRPEAPRTLVLEAGWEKDAIRLVVAEPGADGQTVLPQRRHGVDEPAVQHVSARISSALESAAHGRKDAEASLHELEASGRELFDLLLDSETKSSLLSSKASCLLLRIDDHLITIPWELLFDGERFLGERFAVGRQVLTDRRAPESGRMRECRSEPVVKVLGGGNENLTALTAEARGIRGALAESAERWLTAGSGLASTWKPPGKTSSVPFTRRRRCISAGMRSLILMPRNAPRSCCRMALG
jgi:hypothetical protein